ncbi:hypothetical protein BDM02DRAFT_3112457 [Thelephora ganbajun]|uniref:Uncharacterized protein n=1 Tax=Thelephora ganbajun TaxID=370292 RepID=A0ACB6ZLE6_THEGA|nr:hypothetical protein BDM02DRAFT_3112457 [Thelephora ganbajun]
MQVPPKQRINIVPFDSVTQRDAFSVGLDGLKGWNVNALISETPQAREDRRRKKELKKLAKSHALGSFPQHASATPVQTDRTPGPRTITPKPAHSNLVGRPLTSTPVTTNPAPSEHTPMDLPQKRGKKRELEDSATTVTPQQNHRQATPPATIVNGTNGARPRPIKKQRVDVQGPTQTRDLPFQQQPTPQGI